MISSYPVSKLKILLSITLFVTFAQVSFAQQHFRFRYLLKSSRLNNKGKLFEIATDTVVTEKHIIGYIDLKGISPTDSPLPIYRDEPKKTVTQRFLPNKLKCRITINESKDTLTIIPWYGGVVKNSNGEFIEMDDDNDYKFAITKYSYSSSGKLHIDIPFRFSQLTATSIPMRVSLKTGQIDADFLNINLSYFFLFGRTRFYKSKHVDSRNFFGGLGPYIGGSTIDEGDKKLFGLNYGLSGTVSIYGANLILAVGAESGFTNAKNAFNPYLGVGIGIKLIDIYDASLKEDK